MGDWTWYSMYLNFRNFTEYLLLTKRFYGFKLFRHFSSWYIVLLQVTDEQCLSTLNVADWNVHRAIKLVKLQCLLNSGSSLSSLPSNQIVSSTHLSALESTNWDVSKAATLILSRLKNSNDPKPEIILV